LSKEVTLRLDEFGQEALDRLAERGTVSDGAAVTTAVLYYLADRTSARAAWRVPKFAAPAPRARRVKIRLDDATWAALAEEADRQGTSSETLATHALLYILADLASGRIAGTLEEALDRAQ